MVAIYTRQSVDRADSISVELQAETRRAKLTANELETCKTYTDKGFFEQKHKPTGPSPPDEGRSGKPGGKIFVYKIDHISRNVHDFTGLCQQLSERGAEFPPGSPLTTARPVADVTLGIQNDASSHNTLDKLSKDSDVPRVYRIKLDVLKTHEERY